MLSINNMHNDRDGQMPCQPPLLADKLTAFPPFEMPGGLETPVTPPSIVAFLEYRWQWPRHMPH
jgi:hypothetical protein